MCIKWPTCWSLVVLERVVEENSLDIMGVALYIAHPAVVVSVQFALKTVERMLTDAP